MAVDLLDLITSGNNAEVLSNELRERIHVETPLEENIRKASSKNELILLIGQPGDGKTMLLEWMLREGLIEEERIKRDFSDSSAQDFQTETLVPAIKEIRQNSSLEDGALAIAINEGPLWRMVMSLRDSDPDLNDLCEYVTEDWTWEGDSRKQEGLEVIRMDRRNILLGEIPDKLYSRFVEIESEFSAGSSLWKSQCDLLNSQKNAILEHLKQCGKDTISNATMRELSEHLAWVVAGWRYPEEVNPKDIQFNPLSRSLPDGKTGYWYGNDLNIQVPGITRQPLLHKQMADSSLPGSTPMTSDALIAGYNAIQKSVDFNLADALRNKSLEQTPPSPEDWWWGLSGEGTSKENWYELVDDEEVVFELNGVFGVEDEEKLWLFTKENLEAKFTLQVLARRHIDAEDIVVDKLQRIGSINPGPSDYCLSVGTEDDIKKSDRRNRLLIDRNEWNEIKSASSDISPPLKSKILRWYNNKSTNASKFVKKILLHRTNESQAVSMRWQSGKFKSKK